ncbi:MAG: fluoride efflux transporter CrcB [Bacteroidetes bacterium]|nr:fluoride efflux transporter CrcB [Fibrella sp.]
MTHPIVLVFVGGGVGSVVRYGIGRLLPVAAFPIAILVVNTVASAILGWVVGWLLSRSAGEEARLLIGVGFCGGLSTFSSFSYDTLVLLQNGRWGGALLNVVLNVVFCLVASAGGLWVASR